MSLTLKSLVQSVVTGVVTVAAVYFGSLPAQAQSDNIKFHLSVNPKFASCLAQPGFAPEASVTVFRGKLNDTLVVNASHLRPGLKFDLFTTQRSQLRADGTVDPNFPGFGLAWYQSDLQADSNGNINNAQIKTILLDQIFGFDPDVTLAPTNTFHVGFWFNNPNDANTNGCTFNVLKPTPFNGEHQAGPNAMISTPNGTTGLGPLCTNPNTSTNPISCNP